MDLKVIEGSQGLFEEEFMRFYKEGYKLEGNISSIEYYGKIIYSAVMVLEKTIKKGRIR